MKNWFRIQTIKLHLKCLCALFLIINIYSVSHAQEFDLLLKGGHVIDPKNNIDTVLDVAISDGIVVRVSENISVANADLVLDVEGYYVVPGLIDIHAHIFHGTEQDRYLSNSYLSVPPDNFSFRYGVTTMVDVGGAG